ncbi:MAG: PhnD/SsuA/transferrin family substrate-binding protein [Nitrospirae bacterium]|nr:PhnD/SsuA/transferrin family substrate-binding protein [Nitrospirota bacterium]
MTWGLRQRLTLTVAVVMVVSMTVVGLWRIQSEKRERLETAEAHGREMAEIVADLVGPLMARGQIRDVDALIVSFLRGHDVYTLEVLDPSGDGFSVVEKPVPETLAVRINPQVPIRHEGMEIGSVRLLYVPREAREGFGSLILQNVAVDAGIVIFISFILVMILSRLVVRPLAETVGTITRVAEGGDFTVRLDESRYRGEFGELARGVNGLVGTVRTLLGDVKRALYQTEVTSDRVAMDTKLLEEGTSVQREAMESTSSSIAEMGASIKNVAASADNLSTSAEETASSIHEMAASIENVAESAGTLSHAVEETSSAIVEVTASISQVGKSVDQLASAVHETAAAVNEIGATIREVESAARESAGLAEDVMKEASETGMQAVEAAREGMTAIRETVTRGAEVINRLGARSEEIGKILTVIAEVTDQTSLLALNAAILAAQAGEYGKGFAVVADEIKELAERTANSTKEIEDVVEAVRREASDAVRAMEEGVKKTEGGVRLSLAAGRALETIVNRARQSVERAQGIERATGEQARGVRQVGVAMEHVREMIDQILRATQEQRGGSESIMRTAERMRDLTHQVGRATSDLAQGSRQIIQAVESTTDQVMVIVEATKEQEQGSHRIMDSIERISRIPRQTAGVAKVMAGAARDLVGEAGRFRETVRAYRTAERRTGGTALAFGVIPLDRADVMREKFKPLADYLSHGLGRPVDLKVPDRYEACLRDIWEEEADFAYLTPTTYIEARHKFGVSLVAKALRNGLPFNHSAIVVPPGSRIARLEQIAGKRVAFGDERSTSSYLMPRLMLARAGVRLIDLDEYSFFGHHDRVAEAVLGGEADAGGMMEATARRFAERGLGILAVSPDIPEFCVVAAAGTPAPLADRVRELLTGLSASRPEDLRILKSISSDYTGFAAGADADYDGVRTSVQEVYGITYTGGGA